MFTRFLRRTVEARLRSRLAMLLVLGTAGLAVGATPSFARAPSPTGGTATSAATDPANANVYLTQLFALGEVDLSTLGVAPAELIGVGPSSAPTSVASNPHMLIVGNNPAQCPNAQYPTIQAAVNAATPGAAIKVCPGTYVEQVTIPAGKDNLTLFSEGDLQAIIKAPPVMLGREAIVEVSGALNVTIRHFTITGPGGGGCNSIRYGVFVGNGGSALITDNHITEIRDTPFSGCQNGIGVSVGRGLAPDGPTTGSATVVHNLIDGYQKGGVLVDNGPTSAEVAFNDIKGAGPTPLIAQNGIQASRNATASIHHNTVSMNNYALPATDSVGILLFMESNTNTSVDHNSTSLNDDGIFLFATVVGLQISHNSSTQNDFTGITADSSTSNNTISYNKASGNGLFDCEDDSVGTGTAGTANFWIKDFGNTESPPGICKH